MLTNTSCCTWIKHCADDAALGVTFPAPGVSIVGAQAAVWGTCWREESPEHDDVIKWKHFLRYWPFVRGIPRSPGNSPHKGQRCGALMFSLICTRINGWVNNDEAGDLGRYRAHYDVTVMIKPKHFRVTSFDSSHFTARLFKTFFFLSRKKPSYPVRWIHR